jgi:D-alanine transaminase
MPAELCYLNGRVLPLADAAISPFDRGYNFGDGVYEMIRVYGGVSFGLDEHLERLFRSARAIDIQPRLTLDEYRDLIEALVRQSGMPEAHVYGQLTRGVAPRNHVCADDVKAADFWCVKSAGPAPTVGRRILSVEDDRWNRCHIKTICLLPNVLAKRRAARAGADEAFFVLPESNIVTEGAASNAFAVKNGVIYTHPTGSKVLAGVTRKMLLELAQEQGIETVEEGKTLDFFRDADEVWMSSTTLELQPILELDGRPVGNGQVGPVAIQLREAYSERVQAMSERAALRA